MGSYVLSTQTVSFCGPLLPFFSLYFQTLFSLLDGVLLDTSNFTDSCKNVDCLFLGQILCKPYWDTFLMTLEISFTFLPLVPLGLSILMFLLYAILYVWVLPGVFCLALSSLLQGLGVCMHPRAWPPSLACAFFLFCMWVLFCAVNSSLSDVVFIFVSWLLHKLSYNFKTKAIYFA